MANLNENEALEQKEQEIEEQVIDDQEIKIVGVGGAGVNLTYCLFNWWKKLYLYKGIDFIVMDTDKDSLKTSPCTNEVLLEVNGDGEQSSSLGELAVEQNKASIMEVLYKTKLLFLIAGLGGKTATSAAPRIAAIAKEMGCFVVSMVVTPFTFEDENRIAKGQAGVEALVEAGDGVIVFDNDYLLKTETKESVKGEGGYHSMTEAKERAARLDYEVRKVSGIVAKADDWYARKLGYQELHQTLYRMIKIVDKPDNTKAIKAGKLSFDSIRQGLLDY